MSPILILFSLTVYLLLLFWVARIADQQSFKENSWIRNRWVYMFALGVYCTSWTFYGLVGTAASQGWYYLPILLGPILLFTLGFPLLRRIAQICRRENIHSIADFLSSRYGKRRSVAVVVTLIVLVATVPYIALQLKAVTDAILYAVDDIEFASGNMTAFTALSMIVFTLLFGTNRLEVARYHSGIMVAIAFESIIKLVALVALGIFALTLSNGFDLKLPGNESNSVFLASTFTMQFWVLTAVSACTIFCLPRMFQVAFVECLSEEHLKFARKGFAIYLAAIGISVFLIAWVGNQVLSGTGIDSDTYVLALPVMHDNEWLGLLAFIGGFSAATAMIIVASLTLSQMLSNDVILPLLVRAQKKRGNVSDYSKALILARRMTVIAVIGLAWLYQQSLADNVALMDIGLIAFALAVQLAPAMLLGLYWQRCNAVGVLSGLAIGFVVWFVALMLPLLCKAEIFPESILEYGLFGADWLRPKNLFGLEFSNDYTRGVVLSIAANCLGLYFISTLDKSGLADRIQAITFTSWNKKNKQKPPIQELFIHRNDLIELLTQFLGESGTYRLLEAETENDSDDHVSRALLEHAEQALSGIIGVASTRAMLSNLSSGESLGVEDVVHIFEETTRSLQFNQELLFASFESISSAISVVNEDLKIVAWNGRYEKMFNYPKGMLRVGKPVVDLLRFNAERGLLGVGEVEDLVETRLQHLITSKPYKVIRHYDSAVIEIKGRPLPKGGYLTTYDDISEFVLAQTQLEIANENLERRVKERTEEVEKINQSLRSEITKRQETEKQLIEAKAVAESSNEYKTLFLATASHDILQPLNAAHLYASALLERRNIQTDLRESLQHLHNAIGAAELIISNLLEISRLDSGTLKPQLKKIALNELLAPLANEFRVQVRQGVNLCWQRTSLWVKSDPNYLRRILQNFLSNAVKYTNTGRILLGVRRRGTLIEVCVYDSGPGISKAHQRRIFDDFYRIETNVEGAGLGLGIALRFSHLLGHKIQLHSKTGKGSLFSVLVPRCEPELSVSGKPLQLSAISSGVEGAQVFYVDDEENNIHALGTLMSNWQCELLSASSVAETESFLRDDKVPDLVLLDYQLQDRLDGIQLAHLIRESWPGVPICIVSAAPDNKLMAALEKKDVEFLRKPIKPSRLRALIERFAKKEITKSEATDSEPVC